MHLHCISLISSYIHVNFLQHSQLHFDFSLTFPTLYPTLYHTASFRVPPTTIQTGNCSPTKAALLSFVCITWEHTATKLTTQATMTIPTQMLINNLQLISSLAICAVWTDIECFAASFLRNWEAYCNHSAAFMAEWLQQAPHWHEILSWSGGHEFKPRSSRSWGA